MKTVAIVIAACLLAACDQADVVGSAPEPEPDVAALCRPAGEPPATLSIGPLDLGPEDFTVRLDQDSYGGYPVLNFDFTDDASEALGRVTTELVGQSLPVMIDGETVMNPILREPILGGEMQLSGQFQLGELETLARRLSPPCQTPD